MTPCLLKNLCGVFFSGLTCEGTKPASQRRSRASNFFSRELVFKMGPHNVDKVRFLPPASSRTQSANAKG